MNTGMTIVRYKYVQQNKITFTICLQSVTKLLLTTKLKFGLKKLLNKSTLKQCAIDDSVLLKKNSQIFDIFTNY